MYDESNDTGATLEDQKGEPYEWEAYQDAIEKSKCSESCDFEVLEYHRVSCPLYTDVDRRFSDNVESLIGLALGK